jgi:hypothetical protein
MFGKSLTDVRVASMSDRKMDILDRRLRARSPTRQMFQLRYGAKLREGRCEERQIATNAGLWHTTCKHTLE